MQVKKKGEIQMRTPKHEKYILPALFPGSSPTNMSPGEGEGEGPRNEVDSLLSRIRYQKKRSEHRSVVVYFLMLLKMS